MIDDLELERRTRTKIESDVALNATNDVTAKAAKSEAPLYGVVTSEAGRDGAIKPAKPIHSGLKINRSDRGQTRGLAGRQE